MSDLTVEPVKVTIKPDIDMKTPPKKTVDGMAAEDFFAYATALLKINPPHVTDQPIVSRMKRIGIEPGKSFDKDKVAPEIAEALTDVPVEAQKLMDWKIATLARVANNWSMNTDTMWVYGNYYLKRAIVAQLGLGANLPEDAIYPLNLGDEKGNPLNGANSYKIHFDKASLPGVLVGHASRSGGISSCQQPEPVCRQQLMPFAYNADGSLGLYFQNKNPGEAMKQTGYPHLQGRST